MSQGSEKSRASSSSDRTPSPLRETRDDEDVDQLEPSSPIQRDSSPSESTQGPTAPAGAMQVPPGMQLPPGFPPMMMMAAPDPNDPNAPPHPMLIPNGYTPMFYPYPGVYPSKSKRRQVKNACTNCQKACKKCDDQRPCPRCVKYGIADDCVDSVRKERKKGIKRGSYKKKQEGEGEVPMQAFAIPPGYPWFPGFAQAGKDGQPQPFPYPYFITPLPAPPPSTSENGASSSNAGSPPAAAAAAAAATAATMFPYQMYYGSGYPYMPGWPADPTQAAAAMAAMQQFAGMAAGASSQTKDKEVKMEEEEDDDEKESEDEDGEGDDEVNSVRRKPPTPPPPKPKEPAKKTKGKETAKRKSRAK